MAFFTFAVLVLCAVSSQTSAQRILKEGPHYTIREYTGESIPIPTHYGANGVSYKFTEIVPTNWTVPEDDGGNFGDMVFEAYGGGEFVARDTVINEKYNTSIIINYKRQVVGYNATAINVLNFGRQRGVTFMGGLWHLDGIWESSILVAAGMEVRMLVESYGVLLNNTVRP